MEITNKKKPLHIYITDDVRKKLKAKAKAYDKNVGNLSRYISMIATEDVMIMTPDNIKNLKTILAQYPFSA